MEASCLELAFHVLIYHTIQFNYSKFRKHFYKSYYSRTKFIFNSRLLNLENYFQNEKKKVLE